MESIPGPHKHLKILAQEGTGGGVGGMTSLLKFRVQMCDHVGPKVQNITLTRIFREWAARAGCVYSWKSIERSSSILENYYARSSSSFSEI